MASFDWQAFCDKNHVPYVTQGPNTASGNISIKCPFCGEADHSEHMGLSLDVHNPVWGCWRNKMHRSKDPALLVARIMGWSLEQAVNFIGTQRENPDDFARAVENLSGHSLQPPKERPKQLEMPSEFRKFNGQYPHAEQRFLEYLINKRGFSRGFALSGIIKNFGLRYAVAGDYAGRIIIPVFFGGKLTAWTARSVSDLAVVRYKSLEDENSVVNIKDSLLRRKGIEFSPHEKTLVLVEGPFDAIKLDCYGSAFGIYPMALFGMIVSDAQMALLLKIGKKYKRIAVLLDSAVAVERDTLASQLREYLGDKVVSAKLPNGVKDPGDLNKHQVEKLAKNLSQGE